MQLTSQEFLLNDNGLHDDLADNLRMRPPLKMREEKTHEVGVLTLLMADGLVIEDEVRHKTTLLEPEDGRKGAREEDTLDSGKSDKMLCKRQFRIQDPAECPVGLLLNTWDGLDGAKGVLVLLRVFDVSVDE